MITILMTTNDMKVLMELKISHIHNVTFTVKLLRSLKNIRGKLRAVFKNKDANTM